jgi:hypothetical protein
MYFGRLLSDTSFNGVSEMENIIRIFLSVGLALTTFLIGVGVVRAAEMVGWLFSDPVYTEVATPENIGV